MNLSYVRIELEKSAAVSASDKAKLFLGNVVAKMGKHPFYTLGTAAAIVGTVALANKLKGLTDIYYNQNQLSTMRNQKRDLDTIVDLMKSQSQQNAAAEPDQKILKPRLT